MQLNTIDYETLNFGGKPAKRLEGWSFEGHELALVTVYSDTNDETGKTALYCPCCQPTDVQTCQGVLPQGACLGPYLVYAMRTELVEDAFENRAPVDGVKAVIVKLLDFSLKGTWLGEDRYGDITVEYLTERSNRPAEEVEGAIRELVEEKKLALIDGVCTLIV